MTNVMQTIHDIIRKEMIEEVCARFVGGSSGLDDMAESIAADHVDACLAVLAKYFATDRRDTPPRKFGQQTPAELEEARAIATQQIEIYGDFQREVWVRFRKHGIWNDHAAVQSALQVIMARNDNIHGQYDKVLSAIALALAHLDHLGTPHSEPLNSMNGGLAKASRNEVTARIRSDARHLAEQIRALVYNILPTEEEEKGEKGEPRGGGEGCE